MQTIWLEFKREGANQLAALGTDSTFYIDGRWSWPTTVEKIHERIAELRSHKPHSMNKYREMLFVGITYSGGRDGAVHSMQDPNPPEWAKCICDAPHESCACPTHPTCQGGHLDENGNALGNRFNRL